MILIADSGSTKCDWIAIKKWGDVNPQIRFSTPGLNPAILNDNTIAHIITSNNELMSLTNDVEVIYFFGAGCGEELFRNKMVSVLEEIFQSCIEINVDSDLAAAVYACTMKPGVVCILGTGSNSCYFDGKEIITRIPSLGYSVMDDGSGNYFGRELLRHFFFKKMPDDISQAFDDKYNLDPGTIKHNLYEKGRANAYLASYAEFIFNHYSHEYIQSLIEQGIGSFFENNLNIYSMEMSKHPIHFVGSIAYYAKANIESICQKKGYTLGNVIQKPMDSLYKNLAISKG